MPGKLPKVLWILLILLITPIGPIAWIVVSRVAAAEAKGGRFEPSIWSSKDHVPMSFGRQKKSDTPRAPDDDPEFLEEVSRKLRDKGLDMICANDVSEPGCGFAVETNRITLVTASGVERLPLMSKVEAARVIVERMVRL